MDLELGRDRGEREALLVSPGGVGDPLVGHLARIGLAGHASAVELVEDRGAVNAEAAGHRVNRGAFTMGPDDLVDIALGQSALDGV